MKGVTPFTRERGLGKNTRIPQPRGRVLSDKRDPGELTPSICEEALTRFSESDDSLAGLIEQHHIEVRDFMVLSFICDQDAMSVGQLCSALGLSRHSTTDCVSRLIQAQLVTADLPDDPYVSTNRVTPTNAGKVLVRRILGY